MNFLNVDDVKYFDVLGRVTFAYYVTGETLSEKGFVELASKLKRPVDDVKKDYAFCYLGREWVQECLE